MGLRLKARIRGGVNRIKRTAKIHKNRMKSNKTLALDKIKASYRYTRRGK